MAKLGDLELHIAAYWTNETATIDDIRAALIRIEERQKGHVWLTVAGAVVIIALVFIYYST